MSNHTAANESRRRRGNARFGRRGAALLLGLIGLIGLVPAGSSATPTFKIRIVDLSSPLATAGQDYTLRTEVVTTCTPVMDGGSGRCGTIAVTVSWWTDPASPKVVQERILMVGGPLSILIPAADVQAPRLHYRIDAAQVWTRSGCMFDDTCPKQHTASVRHFGSTQVS